ncbi:MAG: twin-arginine translocase subunit TatC, partial [Candidatus Altiarchaeales archaeon]|nr:twin-arginine translocase subunit TatC [Candidatus Altiarchaeales archaeon]
MQKPFLTHLEELRRHLITILACFLLATLLAYPLSEPILKHLLNRFYEDVEVITLSPQEALMATLQTMIAAGLIFSSPVTIHQLWRFLSPALTKNESRLLFQAISASLILFVLGLFFSYLILLPASLSFLRQTALSLSQPRYSLTESLSFIYTLSLACAIAFQLPVLTVFTAKTGLLS